LPRRRQSAARSRPALGGRGGPLQREGRLGEPPARLAAVGERHQGHGVAGLHARRHAPLLERLLVAAQALQALGELVPRLPGLHAARLAGQAAAQQADEPLAVAAAAGSGR
jgi:hypothetical protein